MKHLNVIRRSTLIAGMGASMVISLAANAQQQAPVQLRPLPLKHTQIAGMDLAGLEGKQGVVISIEYAPGASDQKHYHSGQLFSCVTEGAVIWEVDGQPPVTLNAGDCFYDPPRQVHNHRNASTTAPAKFLAFFVEDKGQRRTIPVK